MSILLPGFAEPVAQSQACFRAVLDAMAHPGRIAHVGPQSAPSPLGAASAAVLLTLLDADTPTWLDAACAVSGDWLAFHCGAPLVARGQAAFVVAYEMPALSSLQPGTDAAPETAATLVLHVAELGRGESYLLSGPGLREPATLQVRGLPGDFTEQWRANHARFPMGIDLILCAGAQLAALPRSVEIA
jgi:alpha-D-ribose 1-methylphosphonate 5-triphosphate synthase subunit PhnH